MALTARTWPGLTAAAISMAMVKPDYQHTTQQHPLTQQRANTLYGVQCSLRQAVAG